MSSPATTPPSLLLRLIPDRNLTGSLYGTVLATSVLATFAGSERAGYVIAAILVTAVVFAASHAWARALARSAADRAPVDRHALRHAVAHEFAIVEATLPAAIVLLLAALGLWSTETALWIAVILNVVLLFLWGLGLRRLAGGTWLQALAAAGASASLGLMLVALKIIVH